MVFIERDGVATAVRVSLGGVDGQTQMLSHESARQLVGERVIVRGADYLADGDMVRVLNEAPASRAAEADRGTDLARGGD